MTKSGDLLLDTSAAVPLVLADHEHHRSMVDALRGRRLGLAGHALFETYSVLTRLPPPARRSPAVVARLLAEAFPATRHLGADDAARLLGRLGPMGIGGGSVYDALVGATAASHRLPLVTRDVRALDTYRALDVDVVLVA